MKPRLLLADDHVLVLEGLRKLLEEEFELTGMVTDGRALVEAATRLRPDLILLDISMPGLNGIEAARQIKGQLPSAKLLFVTQQTAKEYVRAAFRCGALGYVAKQSAATELLESIRAVMTGRPYVSSLLGDVDLAELMNSPLPPNSAFGKELTPRQREVLQLVAAGKSAKEVAHSLHISPKTVEFHKAAIMEELGLRSTAELVRYAIENGIFTS